MDTLINAVEAEEIKQPEEKAHPKAKPWVFPQNPDDLLSDLPRDEKGRFYPADNTRIRPEKHSTGNRYNPRHHEQRKRQI